MPRRNNRSRRRGNKRARVGSTPAPTGPRMNPTDRMALELVLTGKAGASILGSHKPPIDR